MINTIIFDFDGVIVSTLQSTFEIINSLADKYGYKKIEHEDINTLRSESMRDVIKKLHISLFKLPAVLKDYTDIAQKTIPSLNPINKIPQLLSDLKDRGYDLSIITSNSVENVTLFLNKHHLTFFSQVYSDSSLLGKHVVISRFLKKYRLKNEEAIYVGDEIRDIEAAHKAKIKIISVTWGFNTEEALNRYFPDYLVNQPKQIADVLHKIQTLA